jgi:uncharacterized membrane protein YhiD involved in acid resistance
MLVLGWRVSWPVCAAGGARALLCAASIGTACESGMYTAAQMSYMRASAASRDARDLIWHRSVVKTCAGLKKEDACAAQMDSTRKANNQLMHALEDGDGDALDKAMELHMKRK